MAHECLPRRSALFGLLITVLGIPRPADAWTPVRPVVPRRTPIPRHGNDPLGQNRPFSFPKSQPRFRLPGGSHAPAAEPPPPAKIYYSPAGMHLTDAELAKAERVHSVYQSCVSNIEVEAGSKVATASQVTNAEQLLARVLHRGIEKALQGIESTGSQADQGAARTRLIESIRTRDPESLQDANAGVWTQVLYRDFGGVEYNVQVKEPWWIKRLWDNTLKVELASSELPLATTVIDGSAFGKTIRSA